LSRPGRSGMQVGRQRWKRHKPGCMMGTTSISKAWFALVSRKSCHIFQAAPSMAHRESCRRGAGWAWLAAHHGGVTTCPADGQRSRITKGALACIDSAFHSQSLAAEQLLGPAAALSRGAQVDADTQCSVPPA